MRRTVFALGCALAIVMTAALPDATASSPEYSIQAIRYADLPDFPVSELVVGAPQGEKIDIAMVVWLIRGGGHNILFDSGFYRESWFKYFPMKNYLRPDEAVKLAGAR